MQESLLEACKQCIAHVIEAPVFVVIPTVFACLAGLCVFIYVFFSLAAPRPRPSRSSEKFYTTISQDGSVTDPLPLPCWQEDSVRKARNKSAKYNESIQLDIDEPSIFLSVVVPAYNEENRIVGMLEEAVNYLEEEYGAHMNTPDKSASNANGSANHHSSPPRTTLSGWEILVVSDGSTDSTISTVHSFAQSHILPAVPRRLSGPWTHHGPRSANIAPGSIRVISLAENRGKGGAVTHGLRHVRGQYAIFADADGASKFSDLGSLVTAAQSAADHHDRVVVVGSRAHLVGTAATVQRSALRNFLMYSFHTLLSLLTPPKTSAIKDTQCGFKLFSRAALPDIVPYMHSEGWIFDVEMLMLAEGAGIPVAEVAVGWREVMGSKLNVLKDSLGMAWGLAVLRVCWGIGIYRRGVLPRAKGGLEEQQLHHVNGAGLGGQKKKN